MRTNECLIFVIFLPLPWTYALTLFNLTVTVPLIDSMKNPTSVFVASTLPSLSDFYILHVDPIYDRSKVRSISTYLCAKPYHLQENVWFDHRPCQTMEFSLIIDKWFHDIPSLPWPKNVGVRIGSATLYRYVVIHVQYISYDATRLVGQRLLLTDLKTEKTLGVFSMENNPMQLVTNSYVDLTCLYRYGSIEVFATEFDSNFQNGSAALYRLRDNQIHLMLRTNLAWSQTYFRLEQPVDLKPGDYLLGKCLLDSLVVKTNQFPAPPSFCSVSLMFSTKGDGQWPSKICWNDNNLALMRRFVPSIHAPETLFEINSEYPKRTPDQWFEETFVVRNKSSSSISEHHLSRSFWSSALKFLRDHPIVSLISVSGLIAVLVICLCSIYHCYGHWSSSARSRRRKTISIAGESNSLSGWLTRERFSDDQDLHRPLRTLSDDGSSEEDITFTRELFFQRNTSNK